MKQGPAVTDGEQVRHLTAGELRADLAMRRGNPDEMWPGWAIDHVLNALARIERAAGPDATLRCVDAQAEYQDDYEVRMEAVPRRVGAATVTLAARGTGHWVLGVGPASVDVGYNNEPAPTLLEDVLSSAQRGDAMAIVWRKGARTRTAAIVYCGADGAQRELRGQRKPWGFGWREERLRYQAWS